MKFRVDRDQFADAVAWAGRTVPTRPPLPLLSGLRLECTDAPEPTTVHRQLRLRGVRPGGDVRRRRRAGGRAGERSPARGHRAGPADAAGGHRRRGHPAAGALRPGLVRAARLCRCEDYPPLPAMPEVSGSVPGTVLASAVAQVAVAAGRDDSLPFLTGVRIEVDGDRVTLAATDRYRLAVRTFDWTPRSRGLHRRCAGARAHPGRHRQGAGPRRRGAPGVRLRGRR